MNFNKTDFILITILFIGVLLINLHLANMQMLTEDACGYLNIGRNIFSGKGPVISYNMYQFWPEKYFPSIPYYQSIYPLIAGFIFFLFNLKAVIIANIFLLALNCILIYLISRTTINAVYSFFVALFASFLPTLVFTAIFPWTEQLHLFSILFIILIYLRNKERVFMIGILLGLSYFIRVASGFNILAFLASMFILESFSKDSFKRVGLTVIGILAIIVPYQIFCYLNYHMLYPKQILAGELYFIAKVHGNAIYQDHVPVLSAIAPPVHLNILLNNTLQKFIDFILYLRDIWMALLFLATYILFSKIRKPVITLLVCQGIFVVIGYLIKYGLAFNVPIQYLEINRYSLIPFIMFSAAGFLSLHEILCDKFSVKIAKTIFTCAMAFFILVQMDQHALFLKNMGTTALNQQKYNTHRDVVYAWVRDNTQEDDLITSDITGDVFLLERPFVSMPNGLALTKNNLKDFLLIYNPKVIITKNPSVVALLATWGMPVVLNEAGIAVVPYNDHAFLKK